MLIATLLLSTLSPLLPTAEPARSTHPPAGFAGPPAPVPAAPVPTAPVAVGPRLGLVGPALIPAGPSPAPLQVGSYGSTGLNGALVVPAGTIRVIDLANEGTYDPTNWVVRFDYTFVDIQAGATVQFLNHPSRAPVAWIVQGDVNIGAGATVDLRGGTGFTNAAQGYAEPGPGGFRGGRNSVQANLLESSAGFGPGGAKGSPGGSYDGSGGSYRTLGNVGPSASSGHVGPIYGGPAIFQLVGGSGGGGAQNGSAGIIAGGGGAGGGAILIATDGSLLLQGAINARGGSRGSSPGLPMQNAGGGSGGAVRLASLVEVSIPFGGLVDVSGGTGGGAGSTGRVRIESPGEVPTISGSVPLSTSFGEPQPAFRTAAPRVWISSIGGIPAPPDGVLTAGLGFAGENADMLLIDPGPVDIVVETANVLADSEVFLRIGRAKGHANILGPVILSGTSVTFTNVDLSSGFSALQVRAVLPQS